MSRKKKWKPPAKRQNFIAARGCLAVLAELCGIAGFLLALYIFIRGLL